MILLTLFGQVFNNLFGGMPSCVQRPLTPAVLDIQLGGSRVQGKHLIPCTIASACR